MHNAPSSTSTSLLKATDPSSTCLYCHERAGDTGPTSFHISTNNADMPQGSPPVSEPRRRFRMGEGDLQLGPRPTQAAMTSIGDRHG
jgi:hypothetical protein